MRVSQGYDSCQKKTVEPRRIDIATFVFFLIAVGKKVSATCNYCRMSRHVEVNYRDECGKVEEDDLTKFCSC